MEGSAGAGAGERLVEHETVAVAAGAVLTGDDERVVVGGDG